MQFDAEEGGYLFRSGDISTGDALFRAETKFGWGWILFRDPIDQVDSLEAVDSAIGQGRTAAGYVSYTGRPRFWIYDRKPVYYRVLVPTEPYTEDLPTRASWDFAAYEKAFRQVKAAQARGETYQVNLTYRHHLGDVGHPASFFASRCGVEPPAFAAYLQNGDQYVLSFSPELFLEREGRSVRMRPMKGTADVDEPGAVDRLQNDPKSLAENLMIVDMVRNDLGSICEVGSVTTERFMEIRRYRNLYQAETTVRGMTDAPLSRLLASTLPPASVTGAPKRMTCSIIDALEDEPRGIYCGVIGIATERQLRMSVAIRTAEFDGGSRQGVFGVGSGVVWDSSAREEYAECESKTDMLRSTGRAWALVEATSGEHLHSPSWIGAHLARMARSAREVGVPFCETAAREALGQAVSRPDDKVRLLLDYRGCIRIEVGRSLLPPGRIRATLARNPLPADHLYLRHKTTERSFYDDLLADAAGFDEVLIYNERGELVEFCRGSLMLKLDDRWIIPDPVVGGLPGVAASQWVKEGRADYGRPCLEDLDRAQAIAFLNAVVGERPVDMVARD